MKLVIDTQICENYAAHNGFTGDYRWKFKGGNTFVVDNITAAQQERIERDGIPTLKALLEENNEYYREYIISYSVVADDAPEGDEWDTPFRLSYDNGLWIANRAVDNTGEYAYMRSEIKTMYESYVLIERRDRTVDYELMNGKFVCGSDELRAALEEMEIA